MALGKLGGGPYALVAIKQRERCKTRLAGSLAPAARLELVRSMLAAVLRAARDARRLRGVVVISPERDLVPGTIPLILDGGESLNAAFARACALLRESGCIELVLLPADLPEIVGAELDELVHAGRRGGCAIAPDAAGVGTNALYLAATRPFRFQFGPDSCRLHRQEAERLGLRPRIIRLPGLAFDVDTPADLTDLPWQPSLQS